VFLQKLDASSAKHESVQRELEAALEAQQLAHAEVQNRTSDMEQAQASSCIPVMLALTGSVFAIERSPLQSVIKSAHMDFQIRLCRASQDPLMSYASSKERHQNGRGHVST